MAELDLNTLALRCREALATLADRKGSLFERFPKATCGPASEVVGRALHEYLGIEGHYVCGVRHPALSRNQDHAWFEADGFIIDLTYDQFPGTGLSGWVFPASNPWHARFKDIRRRPGYCMPEGWKFYPYDGYGAIQRALAG